MKPNPKCRFLVLVLALVLGSVLACQVAAQTFTTLYNFSTSTSAGPPSFPYTNSDGANPSGLMLSGNTLYGMANSAGNWDLGTVFALNTDGSGFTNLHNFVGVPNDGPIPFAVLVADSSGSTLYGTTTSGGSDGNGAVFRVNIDGTGFTNLYSFNPGTDGADPLAGLVLSGHTLYGTASIGGSSGLGTVYRINIDGTGFTNLHSFANSEGANPSAELILSGNILYGAAEFGGSGGGGTVFAINTDGSGFTNLHNFVANSDGIYPLGRLVLSGNTLYGTANGGGGLSNGTVFAVSTDGTSFTNLHSFAGNNDGARPSGELVLSGKTLYGTTESGGSAGIGTVFAMNTDGSGFTNLHSFAGFPTEGARPYAGVVLSGNSLYGTTLYDGNAYNGTVFKIEFRPRLTIAASGGNVVLTWPTNVAGFDYSGYVLQSATNLVSPVWTTNSPAPVVHNGLNAVTNTIAGAQQFYRLIQ